MNQVILYNLDSQFNTIDGYHVSNVLDVSYSGETRSFDVYQTPRVSNPTFRNNRHGEQSIILEIAFEKDVRLQYFELNKHVSDRSVINIDGIYYDYTASKFGPIEYMGQRFGSFLLELRAGMAYNIVEGKGGETLLADRDIGDYYIKFNDVGEIMGFGPWFTIIEHDAEINSVTNEGWFNIETQYMPDFLWDKLPIGGIQYTLDDKIDTFRYKHYL